MIVLAAAGDVLAAAGLPAVPAVVDAAVPEAAVEAFVLEAVVLAAELADVGDASSVHIHSVMPH